MVQANVVVDLSHHNAHVDFSAAASEIRAVFHKATQGLEYVNPKYARRRQAAKDADLLFGSYHFGTRTSGARQARHFLNTVGAVSGELVVLDIERLFDERGRPLPSMTLAQAKEFVKTGEDETGIRPGIYGGEYSKELLGDNRDRDLGRCWFWLAQYGNTPECPATWDDFTFWQYTDGTRGPAPHEVEGIGRCDRDIFNGSADELRMFWEEGGERQALSGASQRTTSEAPKYEGRRQSDSRPDSSDQGMSTSHGVSFGWRPEFPDHRDLPYAAMRLTLERPVALAPKVDLRSNCPPVYDQGHLSSCTANAIGAAFEFDRIKQKSPDFMPSRLFIYYNERKMEGTVSEDAGAYIRDGIKSIAKQGVCKEIDWPYKINKFAVAPSQSCYTKALKYTALSYFSLNNGNIDELKSCLAAGFPFIFGFTIYASFFNADTNGGIVPMPGQERIEGGPAVLAVGYDDGKGRFMIQNSWGASKGERGYYYMPYQYLTNTILADDFWTIRRVTKVALSADSSYG